MRSVQLTLAYDGTDYAGWQLQPGQPTVQAALEEALARVTGQQIRVVASGRTDAGVHARGQVVSLQLSGEMTAAVLQRALNAELPADVAVLEASDAPAGFHAIRDAIRKRYRYLLHDGPVRAVFERRYLWHWPTRLDADAMQRAARPLVGEHDFSSFESKGAERSTSVRRVSELTVRRGAGEGADTIEVEIEADGFLYNMVRAIVGTLTEVGRGARPETWPAKVLQATDRSQAGPTAPPQGLCLMGVEYGKEGEERMKDEG